METKHVSLAEMGDVARDVLHRATPLPHHARVVTLTGNLGAGKTTLTQHIAAQLGVTESVTSPTFVLLKTYALAGQSFDRLVHIDAYRLESADELAPLHIDMYMNDPKTLMLIEWPEHIAAVIPHDAVHVTLSVLHDEARAITING